MMNLRRIFSQQMKLSQLFSHWNQVHAATLDVFGRFAGEDLSYSPYRGSWTIGELMLHIPECEEGWFRFVVEGKLERWPDQFTLERYPTVASIQEALAGVHNQTQVFLETLDIRDLERSVMTPRHEQMALGQVIWHVLQHEIHHCGELSLILGLLGFEGLDI